MSLALFHQAFWAGAPAPLPSVAVGIDPRRVRKARPPVPPAPIYVDVDSASLPALLAGLETVMQGRATTTAAPTVKRRRPAITDDEMEAVTLMLALLLDD